MQFRDLKKQYEALKPSIDSEIQKVMNNATFIGGNQVEELEEQLAVYVGVKHCISCGNGTDALSMILTAWDIKEGDAVFVPDFTFFATAEVVSFAGATPVFVDVDEDTFNINPVKLNEAVKAVIAEGKLKPRAVIAVDLFGQPAEYASIEQIANKYNLKILEDGAQGFGGRIGERRACSFGDAAGSSFFPAKPLGCYGDGGAIFINDDDIDEYIRSFAVHGRGTSRYDNIRIGWNSRLDTIQAAIMLPKLKAFQEYELERVNQYAKIYTEHLNEVVKTPFVHDTYVSSWAQYTIQLNSERERGGLQEFLKTKGIPTMVYYSKPMHRQTAFQGVKLYQECIVSEKLCKTVLSLPMHPYLETDEIRFISDKIKEFCSMQ